MQSKGKLRHSCSWVSSRVPELLIRVALTFLNWQWTRAGIKLFRLYFSFIEFTMFQFMQPLHRESALWSARLMFSVCREKTVLGGFFSALGGATG